MNPIRLGVIGGGINSAAGYAHFSATRLDNKFQFVSGIFSRTPQVNLSSGLLYGIGEKRIYQEMDRFFENERNEIDALLILTPSPSHFELVNYLRAMGKPIICEKPITTTLEEVKDLELHFGNSELFVIYNYTGYAMVREIRQLISNAVLGELISINIEMPQSGFIKKNRQGGFTVPQEWRLHDGKISMVSLDLGVHIHSLIKFTCGIEAKSVFASANNKGNHKNIIDNVHSIIAYENNAIANIWYGKTALGFSNGLRIRIYGTLGSVEWYQNNPDILILADSCGSLKTIDLGNPDLLEANKLKYNRFKAGHPTGFIEAMANYYYSIAGVLNGEPDNHILSINDSVKGMELMAAIEKSFRSQEKINL